MPQIKIPKEFTQNKLFSGLPNTFPASIFNPKSLITKREGDIIYKTGDESASVYLLLKGEVRVKYSSNNYVSNKKFNDFFGEKEIVDDTRRISSAVAFTNVIYYQMDTGTLKKLITKNQQVKNNITSLGELDLPEISKELPQKFSLVEKVKPISFRASPELGNAWEKENNKEPVKPSVITSNLFEQKISEAGNSNLENFIKPADISRELKEELLDDPAEFKDWQFESNLRAEDNKVKDTDQHLSINSESFDKKSNKKAEDEEKKETPKQTDENGINREIVRRVFACIEVIYNSIGITDLIEKSSKALKELTGSESCELILVDEKFSVLKRINTKEKPYKEEHFQLLDGLTGACALQKKILNFERPTEDSRFNSKLDQPGPARLKRILYFPVISEAGESVAVIQLARENKKFTELDIAYLNMLAKQLLSAIERAYRLDAFLNEERQKANKNTRELLLAEIKDPINIINNYANILSEKKLPEEIDEVIRMLQKQANSIEDITDSVLSSCFLQLKSDLRNIHFNEFIEDILELLSEYCQARGVTLFKKIGTGALVSIDRGKFYSAIYQIIKYSCSDAKQNGKIYLSTDLKDDFIITTIEGEGRGLLANLNAEPSKESPGTEDYLQSFTGLPLAKKIILSHNGQIEFKSIKGKGTTFAISLPISNTSLN
jgi:signal transduction histidine kinase